MMLCDVIWMIWGIKTISQNDSNSMCLSTLPHPASDEPTVMTYNNLLVIYLDGTVVAEHEEKTTLIESCPIVPGDWHDNIVFPHQLSDEFIWTAQWQRSQSWQVGQGCKERCKMNTLMGLVVDWCVQCNHKIFMNVWSLVDKVVYSK